MKQILVVDDDVAIREGLQLALMDEFEVRTVASGEEALEYLHGAHPQAMVLDQSLPGISGLALLQLLEEPGSPNTILLSGLADVELARQAMHLGAEDLLAKPCDLGVLKQRLRVAVDHARRPARDGSPLALRGAWAVGQATERPGSLDARSRWLSRTMVAEAVSACGGDRDSAAQRLGMSPEELGHLVVDLNRPGGGPRTSAPASAEP